MTHADGQVKLLLSYDPTTERREEYFHYVLGEFVPAMEYMGLSMCEIWHTAYGSYPLRLAGFVAPDRSTMESVLTSEEFQDLELRLQNFVENYRRRIVVSRKNFQF
jgi:hypothetical protein